MSRNYARGLLVVNHGRIVKDGPLDTIVGRLAPHRLLVIELSEEAQAQAPLHERAKVLRLDGLKVWYPFDKAGITVAELIADLSGELPTREVYRATG